MLILLSGRLFRDLLTTVKMFCYFPLLLLLEIYDSSVVHVCHFSKIFSCFYRLFIETQDFCFSMYDFILPNKS